MNELTDREKELVRWIMFLLDITNKYALFVAILRRDFDWLDRTWNTFGIKKEQEKMVEELTMKFGLSLSLETNVDSLKKMKEMTKRSEEDE